MGLKRYISHGKGNIAYRCLCLQRSDTMAGAKNPDAWAKELALPPAPGSPYGLPVPGSETSGRSAVYRHWKFVNQPLLTTIDPEIQTLHDMFEASARRYATHRCLGARHWNSTSKTWGDKFEWLTYAEVAERRKNFGAGVVEIHKRLNYPLDKFGIGLWCQNRIEWQITGMCYPNAVLPTLGLV